MAIVIFPITSMRIPDGVPADPLRMIYDGSTSAGATVGSKGVERIPSVVCDREAIKLCETVSSVVPPKNFGFAFFQLEHTKFLKLNGRLDLLKTYRQDIFIWHFDTTCPADARRLGARPIEGSLNSRTQRYMLPPLRKSNRASASRIRSSWDCFFILALSSLAVRSSKSAGLSR